VLEARQQEDNLFNKPKYNPSNWFWKVGSDTNQVFSSAVAGYVSVNDPSYLEFLDKGGVTTEIVSEESLWDVLSDQCPEKLPSANSTAQDTYKNKQLSKMDLVQFKIAFNHENRIRALEGKAAITQAQFQNAVKALL
jgi:hypothetical protein